MDTPTGNPIEFHLARGGPMYRLLVPARLLSPEISPVWRAILFLVLITWVPLCLLSLAQGVFIGDAVRVPLLYSISTHVRYFIAVPLFVLAEPFVDKRLALASGHFVRSDLLKKEDLGKFQQAIFRAEKHRDAVAPELLLFFFALAAMSLGPQLELPRSISTWQLFVDGTSTRLTLAGWWNAAVSSTVFRFLIFRWLWRLTIWTMFLRRVSRLKLRLYPTHPDYAGGLGFLGVAQASVSILVFAGACVLSANFAQTIFFQGVHPASFISITLLYMVIGLFLVYGPLFFFSRLLFLVKFDGMHEYLMMSTEYNRLFYLKWLRGKGYESEAILGTEDIQSLAALDPTIGMIRNMMFFPCPWRLLYLPVFAAALPMIPLIAFEVSLDEILLNFLDSFF